MLFAAHCIALLLATNPQFGLASAQRAPDDQSQADTLAHVSARIIRAGTQISAPSIVTRIGEEAHVRTGWKGGELTIGILLEPSAEHSYLATLTFERGSQKKVYSHRFDRGEKPTLEHALGDVTVKMTLDVREP